MAWDDPPDFTDGVMASEQELDTLSVNLLATAHVEAVSTATVDIISSDIEQTLFIYTLPAGRLGTDRMLELTVIGDYLYNDLPGVDFDLRLKFGTSVLTIPNISSDRERNAQQPWKIVAEIANLGADDSQFALLSFLPGGPLADGDSFSKTWMAGLGDTLWAIDTSVDVVVELTAQWDNASADSQLRKRYATLVLKGS